MNLFYDENNQNNFVKCDMIKSMNEKSKEKLRKLLKVNDNLIYDDVMNVNIFIKNIWISMNLKCQFSIYDLILISRSFKNTEIIYDNAFNENLDDSLYPEKKKNSCFIYFQHKIRKNVVKIFFQKSHVVCFIHKNGSIHIHGSLALRNIILILIKVVKKIKYKTFWYYVNQNQDENTKEQESYSKLDRNGYESEDRKNLNSILFNNNYLNKKDNNKKIVNSEHINNEKLSNEYPDDEFFIDHKICDEFLTDENSDQNMKEYKISNINSEEGIIDNIANKNTSLCDDNWNSLNISDTKTDETNIYDTINFCENIIKDIKRNFSNYEFFTENSFQKKDSEGKIKLSKENYNLVKFPINKKKKKNKRNNKNTNNLLIKKNEKKFYSKNYELNYSENNELLTNDLNNVEELFSSDKISEKSQLDYIDFIVNSSKKKKVNKNKNNVLSIEKDSCYLNIEKNKNEKKNINYIQKDSEINKVFFKSNENFIKKNSINLIENSKLGENIYSEENKNIHSKKKIYKCDKYKKWNYKIREDIIFDMNYFNIKQFVCVFKIKLKYFDITKIYRYDEFENILTDINNIIYIKIDKNLLNKLTQQNNLENYIRNNENSIRTALLFSSGNVVIYACKSKKEVLCISRFIINTLKRNNNIIL